MENLNDRNTAVLLHLSTLTQYFIPFGNYLFPVIIWSSKKEQSGFIDQAGKNVMNFQLSILLYTLILLLVSIPVFIYGFFQNIETSEFYNYQEIVLETVNRGNISGLVLLGLITVALFSLLKIVEFVLIIYAATKVSGGEQYKYPLTINFLK